MSMKSTFLLVVLLTSFILSNCGDSARKSEDLEKPFLAITLQDKIYDYENKQFISYDDMISDLTDYQLIFIGETHNNVYAHRFQLKILKSLFKEIKNKKLALGMEMFERDVQNYLDQYIQNNISEEEFKQKSRPWSNYESDYKPLIEFARRQKLKVLALNTPRNIARMVARHGKETLDSLSLSEKLHIANKVDYEDSDYATYFYSMLPKGHHQKGHSHKFKQFLDASALKDSTMAETIVKFFRKKENKDYTMLVINGKFHSDYGIAIPKRVKNRMYLKTVIITIIPVPDSSTVKLKDYIGERKKADYIIFTRDKKSYL